MQLMERQWASADFIAGFSTRLPQFVEDSTVRQLAAPELAASEPEIQLAVREATERGAEMVLQALRSPGGAAQTHEVRGAPFARTAAQHGIPLTVVLQGYRISHAVIVDHLLDHAACVQAPTELVQRAMRNLFWYMDSLVGIGSRTYVEERRRINSRPERARYVRIRAVLDGATELGMPYPLDADHVAIVLRAPQPTATLAAVATAAGDAPLLVTEAPDGKIWAWLACDQCEQEIVNALRKHGRGAVAAGVSGHEGGVAGFRAVNRKAQLALRLGSCQGSAVTTFADIALEALAVGGEDLAREFVAAEMGELAADNRRTEVVRNTVSAYFACRGAAAAARRLHVSERTVTYRLRHAEQLLARPLTTRRAELETALRLHRLLADVPDRVRTAA
jgi:PucR C-terminal helix-turn-helix domain/GGDEF-like domain